MVKKKHKSRKPPLLGKLKEITDAFNLKWQKLDYSKARAATCHFCRATIYYTEVFFRGMLAPGTQGSYAQIHACKKCAVAAGLMW